MQACISALQGNASSVRNWRIIDFSLAQSIPVFESLPLRVILVWSRLDSIALGGRLVL